MHLITMFSFSIILARRWSLHFHCMKFLIILKLFLIIQARRLPDVSTLLLHVSLSDSLSLDRTLTTISLYSFSVELLTLIFTFHESLVSLTNPLIFVSFDPTARNYKACVSGKGGAWIAPPFT